MGYTAFGQRRRDLNEVVAAGGLFVLGTNIFQTSRFERHLRGRAGRQGDPGESALLHSLDDPEIRLAIGAGINRKLPGRMFHDQEDAASGHLISYAFGSRSIWPGRAGRGRTTRGCVSHRIPVPDMLTLAARQNSRTRLSKAPPGNWNDA